MSSSVTYTLTPPIQLVEPSVQSHITTSSLAKRKRVIGPVRVGFDQEGSTPQFFGQLTIALRMAEKHENSPSTIRTSKYRKTIDLRSASGWTKWNLDLFNVKFEKGTYTDLPSYLGKDSYRMDSHFADGNTI
jgi:hypothetical protein